MYYFFMVNSCVVLFVCLFVCLVVWLFGCLFGCLLDCIVDDYRLLIARFDKRAYICFLLNDHELGYKLVVMLLRFEQVVNSLYNFGFVIELFHRPFGNRLFSQTNTNNGSLLSEEIVIFSHVATDSI